MEQKSDRVKEEEEDRSENHRKCFDLKQPIRRLHLFTVCTDPTAETVLYTGQQGTQVLNRLDPTGFRTIE